MTRLTTLRTNEGRNKGNQRQGLRTPRNTLLATLVAVALTLFGCTFNRSCPKPVLASSVANASVLDGTGANIAHTDELEEESPTLNVATGHLNFESPHSNPIVLLPDNSLVYVANTPADTVDVIDTASSEVVDRIKVGIDPVGLAVKPDGSEVWVSNHVSDSVSVIDVVADSPTRHQILVTIQQFDEETRSTRFDEPVGIAFASNDKAYVALSSSNRIAVVDASTYAITSHLTITAQDPRAIAVQGNRLYVIPFESNNKTAVSGCRPENMESDPLCTFDAMAHVVNAVGGNAQSLSLNYVLDIVRHPRIPDRDLYVFDTDTDELVQIVDTLGTLLYGIAVDSNGHVYVAQAEARNDANGKAGTEKHGLKELENRAFLNQITKVDCTSVECGAPEFIDLEPLPPVHPEPDMALATPFAIQVSADNAVLVATAAASDKLFTVDATNGSVLGRVETGVNPRGVALVSSETGAVSTAWILNAIGNTVASVDLTDPASPAVTTTIELEDPTDPDLKLGRAMFNSALASSTATFSCASCHPDGHTDQLLWVLAAPLCDVGCDQIQPRLVQDIRGLRGTAPYHWDGTLGDPHGGVNTASIQTPVEPNCDINDSESCTLHLIDATLEAAMCDPLNCPENEDGKLGPLDSAQRSAMAKYLLSVPYPPAPERPYTNELTDIARTGIHEFHNVDQCGNCHRLPHWTNTNMGGSGMDVPSWRGAHDRWKNAPQNRFFFADWVGGDQNGFPERTSFMQNERMWQMVVEGSQGVSGTFARQVTLSQTSIEREETIDLLNALEQAATEDAIVLQGEGVMVHADGSYYPMSLHYSDVLYHDAGGSGVALSSDEIVELTRSGYVLLTLTAKLGRNVDYEHPQPTLTSVELPVLPMFPGARPMEFPELHENAPMRIRGQFIYEGAHVYVNGRRVDGQVQCEKGELPNCEEDIVLVSLERIPVISGMHTLQIQNDRGLFSNDYPFWIVREPARAESGNLISSRGTFNGRGSWQVNATNAFVSFDGEANFSIVEAADQPWAVQLSHTVAIAQGEAYSLCYSAKSDAPRYIQVDVDSGPSGRYQSTMGTRFVPEVGAPARGTGATLTTDYHEFRHRFVATETTSQARVRFDMAQSDRDVQLDNVGLYRGAGCGDP